MRTIEEKRRAREGPLFFLLFLAVEPFFERGNMFDMPAKRKKKSPSDVAQRREKKNQISDALADESDL